MRPLLLSLCLVGCSAKPAEQVRLVKRLYKDGVFTVVLTPRFNRIHHNHLHLDAASYSVDGT